MKASSHRPSLEVGDLVRVRLPHHLHDEVIAVVAGPKKCIAYGDPSDAWIQVLIEDELKDIHVDYIKEVISEDR